MEYTCIYVAITQILNIIYIYHYMLAASKINNYYSCEYYRYEHIKVHCIQFVA